MVCINTGLASKTGPPHGECPRACSLPSSFSLDCLFFQPAAARSDRPFISESGRIGEQVREMEDARFKKEIRKRWPAASVLRCEYSCVFMRLPIWSDCSTLRGWDYTCPQPQWKAAGKKNTKKNILLWILDDWYLNEVVDTQLQTIELKRFTK